MRTWLVAITFAALLIACGSNNGGGSSPSPSASPTAIATLSPKAREDAALVAASASPNAVTASPQPSVHTLGYVDSVMSQTELIVRILPPCNQVTLYVPADTPVSGPGWTGSWEVHALLSIEGSGDCTSITATSIEVKIGEESPSPVPGASFPPTASPSPKSTATATVAPTAVPTSKPTASPTPVVSPAPTATPTCSPAMSTIRFARGSHFTFACPTASPQPTATTSPAPTHTPSPTPTVSPIPSGTCNNPGKFGCSWDTPTPSPSPSPTTTPSPSPTPTASPGCYTLLGVQVYDCDTTVINSPVASPVPDPSSSAILAHVSTIITANFSSETYDEDSRVNTASDSTPLIGYTNTEHGIWDYVTSALATEVPWADGFYIEPGPCGDCHAQTLNTITGAWWEGYQVEYSGTLSVNAGNYIGDLATQPWAAQHFPTTVAQLGYAGMDFYGDDITAYENVPCPANPAVHCIPHPTQILIGMGATYGGAYVAPAASQNAQCVASGGTGSCADGPCDSITQCIIDGDHLFWRGPCPSSPIAAEMYCWSLYYYGGYEADTTCLNAVGLRTGLDTNGVDEGSGATGWLETITLASPYWIIAQRGTITSTSIVTSCS